MRGGCHDLEERGPPEIPWPTFKTRRELLAFLAQPVTMAGHEHESAQDGPDCVPACITTRAALPCDPVDALREHGRAACVSGPNAPMNRIAIILALVAIALAALAIAMAEAHQVEGFAPEPIEHCSLPPP